MTFTKEQLIEQATKNIAVLRGAVERTPGASDAAVIHLKLAEITLSALAGMEAESVAESKIYGPYIPKFIGPAVWAAITDELPPELVDKSVWISLSPQPLTTSERAELENYRNAQQVAPSITQHFDDIALETAREIMCDVNRRHEFLGGEVQLLSRIQCRVDDACRAAMLQGKAEQVGKMPDDFDFDRFNDVVWLEAVASNPHMHSLTTSIIAMVALELNRRLDADGKPELTVSYGPMPESNGKTNWTAILHRKGEGMLDGITIDRSEYPGRVLYAADRARYLIGEKPDRPFTLDYDADKHSGYVAPCKAGGNSPVIQEGWVTVPVEMTAEQMRAVQIKSELGEHATANLAGAYSLFSEFWRVAISAATKKEV